MDAYAITWQEHFCVLSVAIEIIFLRFNKSYHDKKKTAQQVKNGLTVRFSCAWRRKWDLNPRASFPTYSLSRGG